MGFNLTAFAGGFASAVSVDIEKEEKLAQARATDGVKNMAETYKTVLAENRKTKGELVENINTLRTYDPSASEEQLFEIAKNKSLMDLVATKIKSGDFTADTLKLSNFANIPANNTNSTALELANEMFKIPTTVAASKETEVARTGNLIRDITASAGGRAGERAARETAAAMGVSLEQLQAAKGYTNPSLTSTATANMDVFKKAKTFPQQQDDAQVKLAVALKSGDEKEVRLAKADLMVYKSVIDMMTEPQKQFANKIADVTNRFMFGTPEERKAAKPDYDKMLANVRAESLAKKTDSKEDKIPTLGTLNMFTSGAVARKVAEVHGDLVRTKQLAIIEKPDGTSSLEYTGDSPDIRAKINSTAYNAAKNALSLYIGVDGQPMTRDIAAVLNTYIPQSVMKTPPPSAAGQTNAALPSPKATSVPAPKTKAEYDIIPKGTRYIDTDGKEKIKG